MKIDELDQIISIERDIAKEHLRLGGPVWTGAGAQGKSWTRSIPCVNGNENATWLNSVLTRSRETPIVIVMCEKDDDPKQVQAEARAKLRSILSRDGITRTVKELKEDALADITAPRSPEEMVPWLREYWGKLDVLQSGIESGSITVERPEILESDEIETDEPETIEAIEERPEPDEQRPHPLDLVQQSQQKINGIWEEKNTPGTPPTSAPETPEIRLVEGPKSNPTDGISGIS